MHALLTWDGAPHRRDSPTAPFEHDYYFLMYPADLRISGLKPKSASGVYLWRISCSFPGCEIYLGSGLLGCAAGTCSAALQSATFVFAHSTPHTSVLTGLDGPL